MQIDFEPKYVMREDGKLYAERPYRCPEGGHFHLISEEAIERARQDGELTLPCSGLTIQLDR